MGMRRTYILFILLILTGCSDTTKEEIADELSNQVEIEINEAIISVKDEAKNQADKLINDSLTNIEELVTGNEPENSNGIIHSEGTTEQYRMEFKSLYDGETFTAKFLEGPNKGETVKIRLLLVDSSEMKDEKYNGEPQPFAKEAKEFAESLLENGEITGEFDVGERIDRYGRTLLYVRVDGKMIQTSLVENGLARVGYVFPPNTRYLDELQNAEEKAKTSGIGIWSIEGFVTRRGFSTSE
ncbi:thermonuclease family protein [Psychrobacillus sp. FSL K6-2684]|uniref:thermonuclease family protein n=1 Tax=unclassified Psychrobacillus TaxID=2636677 RepID=UPI0030FAF696